MAKFINHIEITNFKSIQHAVIENCKQVNVFIGYPNVGKSNILEAIGGFSLLELDKQSVNFASFYRAKSLSELFFNQNYRSIARIILDHNREMILEAKTPNRLSITIQQAVWSHGITVTQNIYYGLLNYQLQFEKQVLPGSDAFEKVVPSIRRYEFNNSVNFQDSRDFSLATPDGNNLLDILKDNAELRKEAAKLFEAYNLKLIIDVGERSIKLLKELGDGAAISLPYHLVADTLRRLLFFKAAILSNVDSVLLFEEPEAHMFPPYISKLTTDILDSNRGNQYFISTHSPFVLNDLMEELDEDKLAIYAVGYRNDQTIINRLTDEQVTEIYQYGVDLFFNLEDYLQNVV